MHSPAEGNDTRQIQMGYPKEENIGEISLVVSLRDSRNKENLKNVGSYSSTEVSRRKQA
jgi:hypothetical protein